MQRHPSFTRRIVINKDISSVFSQWAIQDNMEKWFLKTATFFRRDKPLQGGTQIREGDTYKWIWHTWPDNIQEGVVTECDIPNHFAFTFDPGGNVDVVFEEKQAGVTEVAITQSDILTDGDSWYHYYYGCSLGWSFWLVNLKAYLEHGIVLDQREILYQDERHMHMVNQ